MVNIIAKARNKAAFLFMIMSPLKNQLSSWFILNVYLLLVFVVTSISYGGYISVTFAGIRGILRIRFFGLRFLFVVSIVSYIGYIQVTFLSVSGSFFITSPAFLTRFTSVFAVCCNQYTMRRVHIGYICGDLGKFLYPFLYAYQAAVFTVVSKCIP